MGVTDEDYEYMRNLSARWKCRRELNSLFQEWQECFRVYNRNELDRIEEDIFIKMGEFDELKFEHELIRNHREKRT